MFTITRQKYAFFLKKVTPFKTEKVMKTARFIVRTFWQKLKTCFLKPDFQIIADTHTSIDYPNFRKFFAHQWQNYATFVPYHNRWGKDKKGQARPSREWTSKTRRASPLSLHNQKTAPISLFYSQNSPIYYEIPWFYELLYCSTGAKVGWEDSRDRSGPNEG